MFDPERFPVGPTQKKIQEEEGGRSIKPDCVFLRSSGSALLPEGTSKKRKKPTREELKTAYRDKRFGGKKPEKTIEFQKKLNCLTSPCFSKIEGGDSQPMDQPRFVESSKKIVQ